MVMVRDSYEKTALAAMNIFTDEISSDKTQDAAFRVLDTALQIDFSLLEHRMSALWHCLLNVI